MKIEGATVVVAGGSAGIGLGCARAFARHSAGAGSLHSIEEESLANFRTHFDSTTITFFNVTRALIPGMLAAKRGHLVVAGDSPIMNLPFPATGYQASRAAMWALAIACARICTTRQCG